MMQGSRHIDGSTIKAYIIIMLVIIVYNVMQCCTYKYTEKLGILNYSGINGNLYWNKEGCSAWYAVK